MLANPKTALLDVAKNPLLNSLVKHTLYRQFNAGENKLEVQQSIRDIKDLGYRGVLLGYAREVLVGESDVDPLDEKAGREEVQTWLDGTLTTVDMAQEGDFVALKYVTFPFPFGENLANWFCLDSPVWVTKPSTYCNEKLHHQNSWTPLSAKSATSQFPAMYDC